MDKPSNEQYRNLFEILHEFKGPEIENEDEAGDNSEDSEKRRYPQRERKSPSRNLLLVKNTQDDPSVKEALISPDKDKRIGAIKS